MVDNKFKLDQTFQIKVINLLIRFDQQKMNYIEIKKLTEHLYKKNDYLTKK